MKFSRSLLPEWRTDRVMASTSNDISHERMGSNGRRWTEHNNGVGGGGILQSGQDTLAKVECYSSSISVFPGFCLFQIQTSSQAVWCKNSESRKKIPQLVCMSWICRKVKGINQLHESCTQHFTWPAQCVWVQGYYSLLFQKMRVYLVCTLNWIYKEKFIAGVIHNNYHGWLVDTC